LFLRDEIRLVEPDVMTATGGNDVGLLHSCAYHNLTWQVGQICDVYGNRGINVNSFLSVEKARKDVWKRLQPAWNNEISITLYLTVSYALWVKV